MIHEVLKLATRPSHEALDSGLGEGLTGITLSGYRHMLGRFLGLFDPIERDLLRSEKLAAVLPDFADRLRTPSLTKDLRALGMTEEEVDVVAEELAKIGGTAWYPGRQQGLLLREVTERYREQARAVITALERRRDSTVAAVSSIERRVTSITGQP